MKLNKIHPTGTFQFFTVHRLGLKGQCSFSMKNPPRIIIFVFQDVNQSESRYEMHQSAIVLACYMPGSSLLLGVANGTSKNVGLGKFWQDLEISEAFLISLEVSFLHGLHLLFLSLETFYPESRARISN